ncbi:MAG: DM13 domain-containing protein [Deltaproteobacteria bacterium]|nr:DM13 domain-containing protein [Deltaproteobacteria bacterium]
MKSMWKPVFACFASAFLVMSLVPATSTGGMMEKERTGMLSGFKGHNAAGKVTIEKHEGGNLVLTMTDIKVDKVPDGRVYLAKDGDYKKGIEIGLLKKFTGTVQFPIPAGTNPDEYDSVVIWCKKFNVGIGRAYFAKKMMKEKEMMKEEGMMKKEKTM